MICKQQLWNNDWLGDLRGATSVGSSVSKVYFGSDVYFSTEWKHACTFRQIHELENNLKQFMEQYDNTLRDKCEKVNQVILTHGIVRQCIER